MSPRDRFYIAAANLAKTLTFFIWLPTCIYAAYFVVVTFVVTQ